jgi:dTDP-4-dehydrorhamnose reductase
MRILILGGTGMFGHKLWQHLGARFPDTFVTVRKTRADYRRYRIFDDPRVIENIELSRQRYLLAVLNQAAPDVIVNCVAITKRHQPALNPLPSIQLNAMLPHRLADWANANGARLISVSTDCVFDGKKGDYTEEDEPNAWDLYGRTKALGEIADGSTLTIRTSFIGRELNHGTELLEWFLQQSGGTVKGFRRALYSGVSTMYFAGIVGDIIEKFPHLRGLYQVASPVITKFDLLCLTRDAFGIDVGIEPDDTVILKRNLNGEKFRRATGIVVPSWREMMNGIVTDPTPYGDWKRGDAL